MTATATAVSIRARVKRAITEPGDEDKTQQGFNPRPREAGDTRTWFQTISICEFQSAPA